MRLVGVAAASPLLTMESQLATGSRGRSGQAMGSSSGSRMRLELLPALASLHCERELGEVDARQLASLAACLPSTLPAPCPSTDTSLTHIITSRWHQKLPDIIIV